MVLRHLKTALYKHWIQTHWLANYSIKYYLQILLQHKTWIISIIKITEIINIFNKWQEWFMPTDEKLSDENTNKNSWSINEKLSFEI